MVLGQLRDHFSVVNIKEARITKLQYIVQHCLMGNEIFFLQNLSKKD